MGEVTACRLSHHTAGIHIAQVFKGFARESAFFRPVLIEAETSRVELLALFGIKACIAMPLQQVIFTLRKQFLLHVVA